MSECGATPSDLHGLTLYAGLDLSSVSDLTALVLIGRVDQTWHVHPTFWLPSEEIPALENDGVLTFAGILACPHGELQIGGEVGGTRDRTAPEQAGGAV